jgi:hypothetical protein
MSIALAAGESAAMACLRCAGQYSPPVQRPSASSSRRSTCRAADRTLGQFEDGGQARRQQIRRAALQHDRHHLGDDVAGAAHDHRVADAHVLAPHLVSLCSVALVTVTPPTKTGCQACHRRDRAGTADLHLDAQHLGQFFLRRVLVRARPSAARG